VPPVSSPAEWQRSDPAGADTGGTAALKWKAQAAQATVPPGELMDILKKLIPPANKDRFAAMVVKRMKQVGYPGEANYDKSAFKIDIGASHHLYLENAYAEYRYASFKGRREIVDRFARFANSVSAQPQEPTSFAEAKSNLMPKVRERFYHEALRLRTQAEDGKWLDVPMRVMAELLTLEMVYDLPDGMRTTDNDSLSKWGVSFDDAMKVARENLWAKSNRNFIEVQSGLYLSPWRDNYDACRLVLHDLIWQLKVKGDHVACVPHRDILLVSGADDEQGLVKMFELIDEVRKQPRFMASHPFRLQGSQWMPLMLPAGHPAEGVMRENHIRDLARDYAEQKQLLDALHQKKNQDVFVASLLIYQHTETRAITTRASWLDGTDTLLPKADQIIFAQTPDGQEKAQVLGWAPWERVMSVAGDAFTSTEMFPPRFRVKKIPTMEQLRSAGLAPMSTIGEA